MPEDTTTKRILAQELPTNPFVDVGMMLFLEDIAEKQGIEGLLPYMMNQGTALAESMSPEDYPDWDSFIVSINEGRSILSALEGVQHFAGKVVVTPVNPFHEAIGTYIRLMGEMLPAHREVTELYNGRVQNSAVESMNIVHQAFRKALTKRITVAGQAVRYAELASKGFDGSIRVAPEGWQEVLLEKAGISATQLQMAIRQNSLVYLVYPPEVEAGRAGAAETASIAPRVLGLKTEEALLEETVEHEPEAAAAAVAAGGGDGSKGGEESKGEE